MAYDWSGNTVRQQRCDWVIIAALLALALVITATPLALMRSTVPSAVIETTAVKTKMAPLKS